MFMPARPKLAVTAVLLTVLLHTVSAPAQDPFYRHPSDATLRDIVVDGSNAVVFVAAYDREEIWKLNTAGDPISTAPTGTGPVSLALSADGRLIACVNKLSASVMIFDAQTMAPKGTFACGEGASAITSARRSSLSSGSDARFSARA